MSTSRLDNEEGVLGVAYTLQEVVAEISAGADHRDRHPSFPEHPFRKLARSGMLAIPVPDPVGAEMRTCSPERIAGQARCCGSVAEPKRSPNQSATRG